MNMRQTTLTLQFSQIINGELFSRPNHQDAIVSLPRLLENDIPPSTRIFAH